MAFKYKALQDRKAKSEDIEIELPGGEVIKFHSPLKFKGGKLYDILERMEQLGESGISGINTLIDDMAVDPKAMRTALEEDDALVDADTFGIFQHIGIEYGKQMGTLGESKA